MDLLPDSRKDRVISLEALNPISLSRQDDNISLFSDTDLHQNDDESSVNVNLIIDSLNCEPEPTTSYQTPQDDNISLFSDTDTVQESDEEFSVSVEGVRDRNVVSRIKKSISIDQNYSVVGEFKSYEDMRDQNFTFKLPDEVASVDVVASEIAAKTEFLGPLKSCIRQTQLCKDASGKVFSYQKRVNQQDQFVVIQITRISSHEEIRELKYVDCVETVKVEPSNRPPYRYLEFPEDSYLEDQLDPSELVSVERRRQWCRASARRAFTYAPAIDEISETVKEFTTPDEIDTNFIDVHCCDTCADVASMPIMQSIRGMQTKCDINVYEKVFKTLRGHLCSASVVDHTPKKGYVFTKYYIPKTPKYDFDKGEFVDSE